MTLSQLPRTRSTQGRTPKRHSIRIEKPRTPKASPRILTERRKTFTGSSTKPYPSLADHYQAMYGSNSNNDGVVQSSDFVSTTRPLSWHPTSSQSSYGFTSSPASGYGYAQDQITYSPYDQYLPYPSELTQPSSNWFSDATSYSTTPNNDAAGWSSYMSGPLSYSSTYNYSSAQYPPVYTTSTIPMTYTQAPADTRQPTSQANMTSYPTLQRIETAKALELGEDRLAREPSQELIGMGLYDEPGAEPILSGLTQGKTLKLEESWAPPEALVSDDDEDEHEDDEASPVELSKPALVGSHGGAPQLPCINLSNQSFLFDHHDDDTIATNHWWNQQQQPKQLAVPAPAAGYGYAYGYDWYRV